MQFKKNYVLTQPSFARVFSGCIPLGVQGFGSICENKQSKTQPGMPLEPSIFFGHKMPVFKSALKCDALIVIGQNGIISNSPHISSIQVMRFGLQDGPYAVGVFKLHKAKAPGLICAFIFHDDTIHNLSILRKVVSQSL